MGSPPARVARAFHTAGLIESLMGRTDPSANRKLAPWVCRLEKSSSSALGELGGVPVSPRTRDGASSAPGTAPTQVALELWRPRSPTNSVLLWPSVTAAKRVRLLR